MSAGRLRTLGRDSLVYGLLDVANRFVGIFLVPLYTRVLAPADYGVLDLVTTLGMVASAVLFLGLDSALLFRFNETDDADERRRVVTAANAATLLSVVAGALLMYVARGPLARAAVPGGTGAGALVALAAAALPLQAANQVQMVLLRVRRAYRRYAVLSLGMLLLTIALNVWFVVALRMGVTGVLLAQVLARVPAAAYGFWATRHEFAPRLSAPLMGELVRYGSPLVVGNVAYWALLYAERYVLARMVTLGEVGLYGVATRVATFVTLVSMAIDLAWTPFAHSIQREPDAPGTYARALYWYLLAAGAAGTALAMFAREALAVVATPAYAPAYVLVGPIVGALILRGAANMVAIGAMVTRRTREVSAASVASAVVDVALLVALVPVLGGLGAALSTLTARVTTVAWLCWRTRRAYPVPYPWGRIARLAAVFTAAVLASLAASRLAFWPGVAVKLGVITPLAIAALFAAGAVPRREARAVLNAVLARVGGLRGAAAR
ncbi:MAG TPA: lipopolysaccharide biosynthesis protein [Longimicrobium sp.]|nr:lipopolysaccharide biosynthesis protein [Longimicrobium sp.]